MKIRPHHCLCIRMFDGKGYDERFTAHMTGIVESLTDDSKITIWEGCDEICRKCQWYDLCSEIKEKRWKT